MKTKSGHSECTENPYNKSCPHDIFREKGFS